MPQEFAGLTVPTLLVAGEYDKIIPAEIMSAAAMNDKVEFALISIMLTSQCWKTQLLTYKECEFYRRSTQTQLPLELIELVPMKFSQRIRRVDE